VTKFDQIEQASLTDVGVRRPHNQDNLAVRMASDDEQWHAQGHLLLVADGMGGHAVGEKASEQAAAIIPHTYSKYAHDGPANALRKAFQEANASINACGEQNSEFRGMGTTSTALVICGNDAWIGHVGDSRCYRVRNGKMEQLTYDHSYVWEYARLKKMDPEDVQEFPTNVIHRCLGPQPLVQVDVEGPHPIQDGDVYLLCSDGLSGQVSDREMGIVASMLPPAEACRFLIDLANLGGGPDNITVLIARVGGDGTTAPAPSGPSFLRTFFDRVPWPFIALPAGILIALLAIVLKLLDLADTVLALVFFLLALVPIVGGLIGMIIHQRNAKNRLIHNSERGNPKPYRSAPCSLDKTIVEKVATAARTLRHQIEEKQWEIDGESFEKHQNLGDELLRQGDLGGAFREYCRSMTPLNDTLRRYRGKEEVFKPVWDKAPR